MKKHCVGRFCKQFERYFYMKIIVSIIPTDLVTNFLLSYLKFVFSHKPKQESGFHQVGGMITRNTSVFCLWRSIPKPCQIQ